jgi:farnesyl-diphosphate farnesyltransferase
MSEDLALARSYSRSFAAGVEQLPSGLREAAISSYLIGRAVDEIEDHSALDRSTKMELLRCVGSALAQPEPRMSEIVAGHDLPAVTLRLDDWIALVPPAIAPRILHWMSSLAFNMVEWVERNWTIHTEEDLERYAFTNTGQAALMWSDMIAWHYGIEPDQKDAIAYALAAQVTNIALDREEDLARSVDFYPDGWTDDDMISYARERIRVGYAFPAALPAGPVRDFLFLWLGWYEQKLELHARGQPPFFTESQFDEYARSPRHR